jgi:hypothetical protein
MAAMRDELAERIQRYDSWLLQWAEESQVARGS